MKYSHTINRYFEAQNASDSATVVGLFGSDAVVTNVNLPPVIGAGAIKGFCEGLYARTSARKFEVIRIVEGDDVACAEWRVKMTFKAGAQVGPWLLDKPFDVELTGVNRFLFDGDKIKDLRVFHETTTVAKLAQENAKKP